MPGRPAIDRRHRRRAGEGRCKLPEIIDFKKARREQERASRRKARQGAPRPDKRVPTWAYFAGLLLLAALVAALRGL